jgi:hypothetical protein
MEEVRDLPAAAPPWGKSSTKFKLSAQIQYCTNRSIFIAPADPSSTALTDCRPCGEGNEADVRFGSLADMPTSPRHIRFTPKNGSWAAHPSLHSAVGL